MVWKTEYWLGCSIFSAYINFRYRLTSPVLTVRRDVRGRLTLGRIQRHADGVRAADQHVDPCSPALDAPLKWCETQLVRQVGTPSEHLARAALARAGHGQKAVAERPECVSSGPTPPRTQAVSQMCGADSIAPDCEVSWGSRLSPHLRHKHSMQLIVTP